MKIAPALVPVVLFSTAACSRQPEFKPVASVKQIMEGTIHPAAEVIFDSVGTIVSKAGIEEIAPRNEEEWANVRRNALTLAESGNLLLIGDRPRDRTDWIRLSRALVDVGMVSVKAAEARNPDALFEAGGEIYAVCQDCHERYWKEGATRVAE